MSDFNENTQNSDPQEPQAEGKKKLTDLQLRLVQAAAGILCAAALIVSLFFMQDLAETNSLLQYTFLIVFLIIMFGRRRFETKYRLRLGLFGLVLIDGIMAGILGYLVYMFYFVPASAEQTATLSATWKLVIIIGGFVLMAALGIVWPVLRYLKRSKDGTVPPIRLPEKKEAEQGEKKENVADGTLTTQQKIAAMMNDLDGKKDTDEK